MIAFIIVCIMFAAYIYYDPYVDITEDNVLLWYNKSGNREYIILWSRKNLIKAFVAVLLIVVIYNISLWLLSESLYAANILGLLLLLVAIPSLVYRIFKYIKKHYLNKENEDNY